MQVGVRVTLLELRDFATDANGFAAVEVRGEAVMREGDGDRDETGEQNEQA
jgi:hypothetical protein